MRTQPSADLLSVAERMVDQVTALVAEIETLRRDNEYLRTELNTATSLIRRATVALDGMDGHTRKPAPKTGLDTVMAQAQPEVPPTLGGHAEIRALLGLSDSQTYKVQTHPSFPAPVSRGRWNLAEVQQWNARHPRRPGNKGALKPKQRATPASVTPAVVLATIAKLAQPTAAEIAAEISRHARAPISGRAIRHLAEQAGAQVIADNGHRRYVVGATAAAS